MTRLTLLFLLAALVVSGTASARPAPESGQATPAPIDARGTDVAADFRARGGEPAGAASAQERYYASYGEPEPLRRPRPRRRSPTPPARRGWARSGSASA